MARTGNVFVLLHAFVKPGSRIAQGEIDLAQRTPRPSAIDEAVSPIGTDHQTARRRRMSNPEYVRAAQALAPLEALARVFIRYRIENHLTQEQLAEAMGTSASAISRLESGQHQPNLATLRKFANLSQRHLLVGFEDEVGHRELVTV